MKLEIIGQSIVADGDRFHLSWWQRLDAGPLDGADGTGFEVSAVLPLRTTGEGAL